MLQASVYPSMEVAVFIRSSVLLSNFLSRADAIGATVCVALVPLLFVGCNSSAEITLPTAPASRVVSTPQEPTPTTPSSAPAEPAKATQVAETTDNNSTQQPAEPQLSSAEEKLQAINALKRRMPRGRTRDERKEAVLRQQKQILEITDEVLAMEISTEMRRAAQLEKVGALVMMVKGEVEGATVELHELSDRMISSGDEQLVAVGRDTLFQLRLIGATRGNREDATALPGAVRQYLAGSNSESQKFAAASRAASVLEQVEQYDAALATFDLIQSTFADTQSRQIAFQSKMMGASAQVRLGWIGKEIDVEGTLLGGGDLDWESYRGKWVLLDFWSTSCRPCIEEIPNIKAMLSAYKDRGFAVLGVNIDDDYNHVAQFSARMQTTWPHILDRVAERAAKESMSEKVGVVGIPLMILISPDHEVISVSARGERLEALLEKHLGPLGEKS